MNKKFNLLSSSFFLLSIVGSSHASNQEKLERHKELSKTFLTEEANRKAKEEVFNAKSREEVNAIILKHTSLDSRALVYSHPSEEKEEPQGLLFDATPHNNTMPTKQEYASTSNTMEKFICNIFLATENKLATVFFSSEEERKLFIEKWSQTSTEEVIFNLLLQTIASNSFETTHLDDILETSKDNNITPETKQAICSSQHIPENYKVLFLVNSFHKKVMSHKTTTMSDKGYSNKILQYAALDPIVQSNFDLLLNDIANTELTTETRNIVYSSPVLKKKYKQLLLSRYPADKEIFQKLSKHISTQPQETELQSKPLSEKAMSEKTSKYEEHLKHIQKEELKLFQMNENSSRAKLIESDDQFFKNMKYQFAKKMKKIEEGQKERLKQLTSLTEEESRLRQSIHNKALISAFQKFRNDFDSQKKSLPQQTASKACTSPAHDVDPVDDFITQDVDSRDIDFVEGDN